MTRQSTLRIEQMSVNCSRRPSAVIELILKCTIVKSPSFKGDPLLRFMFMDWGSISEFENRLVSLSLSSSSKKISEMSASSAVPMCRFGKFAFWF
jgi:hypothetical protein